jgi:hypothetical protein
MTPTCSRARSRGQAVIEFALVLVLLVVCLAASLAAAIWSVDRMASVAAAENGVRLASTAQGIGASSDAVSLPAAKDALPQLQSGMPGTPAAFCVAGGGPQCPGPGCPGPAAVASAHGGGPWVQLCVWRTGQFVHARAAGCVNPLVPLFVGLGGCSSGIPVDVIATGRTLVFEQ